MLEPPRYGSSGHVSEGVVLESEELYRATCSQTNPLSCSYSECGRRYQHGLLCGMAALLALLLLLCVVAAILLRRVWVRCSDEDAEPPPSHHLVSLQRQCVAALHEHRWMGNAPREDACSAVGLTAAKRLRADGLVRIDGVLDVQLCVPLLDHINQRVVAVESGKETSILSDVLCRKARYDMRLDLGCPVVHAALMSALESCNTSLVAVLGGLTLPCVARHCHVHSALVSHTCVALASGWHLSPASITLYQCHYFRSTAAAVRARGARG